MTQGKKNKQLFMSRLTPEQQQMVKPRKLKLKKKTMKRPMTGTPITY